MTGIVHLRYEVGIHFFHMTFLPFYVLLRGGGGTEAILLELIIGTGIIRRGHNNLKKKNYQQIYEREKDYMQLA